jgi:hypothetical protein
MVEQENIIIPLVSTISRWWRLFTGITIKTQSIAICNTLSCLLMNYIRIFATKNFGYSPENSPERYKYFYPHTTGSLDLLCGNGENAE